MVAKQVKRLRKFLEEDLWKIKLQSLSPRKAILFRQARIWIIAISEFIKDKCAEKASALTYFSLLSVVPVAAMAFGIATIFGLEDYLKRELTRYLAGQEEVLEWTLEFSGRMLSTSSGGIISGISAVFLIYAVARLFNNIEIAFNDIWDTGKGRSLKRMVTDYMSVILLGPLILILSSSATLFVTTQVENFTEGIELLGFFKPVILFLIKLVPYTLIWFLLFLIYVIFPNTSVKVKPALIAGILAGTAYQLTQLAWIEGQVYLSRYSVIYGSFAALPLFLIWLQLSWMILLFGAEMAFAIQNVENWAYDSERLKMNQKTKKTLTLLVVAHIGKYFEKADEPMDFELLAKELDVPRRFLKEIVHNLLASGLIAKLDLGDERECYQPGMDVHKIDVLMVLEKLDQMGMDNLPNIDEIDGYQHVVDITNQLQEEFKTSPANKKILEL